MTGQVMTSLKLDNDAREGLWIVIACLGAAALYGLILDYLTVWIYPQYLTIFHPRIGNVRNPYALAALWGTAGSWWVGLAIGLSVAAVARIGAAERLTWRQLTPYLCALFTASLGSTSFVGLIAFYHPSEISHSVIGWFCGTTDFSSSLLENNRFMAMYVQHAISYRFAGIALVSLLYLILRKRRKGSNQASV
jgi:hypothetical protein